MLYFIYLFRGAVVFSFASPTIILLYYNYKWKQNATFIAANLESLSDWTTDINQILFFSNGEVQV